MTNIMLIDDDPINNLIIEKIGSSFPNVKMHIFEQGLKACEAYRSNPTGFDFILLDINMLDISGWDFLDKCVASGHTKVPVYILTSSIDPRDKEKAQTYPQIVSFLYKPFSRETLREILGL